MNYLRKVCLLLAVLGTITISACSEDAEIAGNPPQGKIPSQLAGEWLESWSLYMQHSFDPLLYNPTTQVWFRGSYDPWSMDPVPGFGLQFYEDGSFIWAIATSTGTGGCKVYTSEYLKGLAIAKGDRLTFYPQTRRMKHHSVCNPVNDFDRDEDKTSFTLQYRISTTISSGQELETVSFIYPDGSQVQYSQQKNQ